LAKENRDATADAIECLLPRWKALRAIETPASSQQAFPPYYSVLSFCNPFGTDLTKVWLGSAEKRELLAQTVAGITPNAQADFAGWDKLLRKMIEQLLDEDKTPADILQELDPGNRAPVIARLVTELARMRADLQTRKPSDALRDALMNAAHQWALRGHAISEDRRARILNAAFSTSDVLENSVLGLIAELSFDPTSDDATLDFAERVNQAYRAAVQKLLALADQYPAAKEVIIGRLLGRALQNHVSRSVLESESELLSLVIAHIKDQANVGTGTSPEFVNPGPQLINTVLEEQWSLNDWSAFTRMLLLAPTRPRCAAISSPLHRLQCSGLRISKRDKGLLDPEFDGRYVRLSGEFLSLATLATQADRASLAEAMKDAFFGPVWKSCSNLRFKSRSKKLSQLILDLTKETDWRERLDLERSARRLLQDC
jgi:hypothetical protein